MDSAALMAGAGGDAAARRSASCPQLHVARRLARIDVPLQTGLLARFLIGKLLVRRLDDGAMLSGRVVETEAYTADDPASHSFRGRTQRNGAMFGAPFHAYVYFIYGSSYCLNITSEVAGVGAAVLIRALEPIDGVRFMRRCAPGTMADRDLLRGPGRICRSFDIDRRFDGADLDSGDSLWLATDELPPPEIGVSARIGLTRAAHVHQRYYARGSPYLSGRRALSP